MAQYLSGFERLNLKESTDYACPTGEISCYLEQSREKNIPVFVTTKLQDQKIFLKAYDTKTSLLVSQSTLNLNQNLNLNELKHHVFRLIKPFVDVGGILDQHAPTPSTQPLVYLGAGALLAALLLYVAKILATHYSKIKIKPRQIKIIGLSLIALLVIVVFAQSISYHFTYQKRMKEHPHVRK